MPTYSDNISYSDYEEYSALLDGGQNDPMAIDNLAKDIVRGNVALVLGHEGLINIDGPLRCFNGSMERFINAEFVNYEKHVHKCMLDPYKNLDIYNNEGINVKDILFNILNTFPNRFNPKLLNHHIRKLLESRYIRVVLTTNPDPLLENTMREIWGDRLEVRNFYADWRGRDITSPEKIVLNEDTPPTLYYLFGKGGVKENDRNLDFVVTEDDRIKVVSGWIKNPPPNITKYLSTKRLMAIGSKFDDWLFRFFWHGVLNRNIDCDPSSLLSISFTDSSDSDRKLKNYLNKKKLHILDNVNNILDDLSIKLVDEWKILVMERMRKGGIFISYCSNDFHHALSLFNKLSELTDNGGETINIWFDHKDLSIGADYYSRIKDGIESCSVFIPVISHVMTTHEQAVDPDKENSRGFHYYRDVEWRMAQDRAQVDKNFHILPFCLPDYNPKLSSFKPEILDRYDNILRRTAAGYDRVSLTKLIGELIKIFKLDE